MKNKLIYISLQQRYGDHNILLVGCENAVSQPLIFTSPLRHSVTKMISFYISDIS